LRSLPGEGCCSFFFGGFKDFKVFEDFKEIDRQLFKNYHIMENTKALSKKYQRFFAELIRRNWQGVLDYARRETVLGGVQKTDKAST
jgi:hypothetical protein